MECLLSASVTGHLALNNVPRTKSLAFFAFPLSFALSESVSVDSFREEEAFLFACLLAGKLYTDLGYLRQFLKHLVSLAMLASLVWLACFLVRYCPAVAFFLCAVLSLVISLRPLSFYFVLALLIGIAPCKRL
ncbi:hypothetical protein V6Z11_A03G131700 [Gossypium hirsutum]